MISNKMRMGDKMKKLTQFFLFWFFGTVIHVLSSELWMIVFFAVGTYNHG